MSRWIIFFILFSIAVFSKAQSRILIEMDSLEPFQNELKFEYKPWVFNGEKWDLNQVSKFNKGKLCVKLDIPEDSSIIRIPLDSIGSFLEVNLANFDSDTLVIEKYNLIEPSYYDSTFYSEKYYKLSDGKFVYPALKIDHQNKGVIQNWDVDSLMVMDIIINGISFTDTITYGVSRESNSMGSKFDCYKSRRLNFKYPISRRYRRVIRKSTYRMFGYKTWIMKI